MLPGGMSALTKEVYPMELVPDPFFKVISQVFNGSIPHLM
jgi:hypothetical protein